MILVYDGIKYCFFFFIFNCSTAVFCQEDTSIFSRSRYIKTLEDKELVGYASKRFDSSSLLSFGQERLRNTSSTSFKLSFKKDGKITCELNK